MKSKPATIASKQSSQQNLPSKSIASSSKKQIDKKPQSINKELKQENKASQPEPDQKTKTIEPQISAVVNPASPQKKQKQGSKMQNSKNESKKSILIDPPRRQLPKSQGVTIKPYLENTFQEVINMGLKQVLAQQPADPIKHLGEFLLKHSKSK